MFRYGDPLFRLPRLVSLGILIAGCWGGLAHSETLPDLSQPGSWPGSDLFSEPTICRVQVLISSSGLAKLRSEPREFVIATLIENGVTYSNVAVHLKGSVGSFRPVDEKPGLTLDFSRFHPEGKFHGLRRIYLDNSVEDPTYCNELLGSELFREAGIPAPRVTHALVFLNDRFLGLYVLKEGFTEDFLACYFKKLSGNLFEPGEGHDVNQRLSRIRLPSAKRSREQLKALEAVLLEHETVGRYQRFERVLDVDRFTRFMAMEIMLGHRDGYCLARNNFRVYEDLDTGRMVFLPHGMDQLFGTAQIPVLPHMAGLTARSLLETPEGERAYLETFRRLFDRIFDPCAISNRVGQIVQRLSAALDPVQLKIIQTAADSLDARIFMRHAFLAAQLHQTEPTPLRFETGVAHLKEWVAVDPPAAGTMDQVMHADGMMCLHILTHSEAACSWQAKVRLAPGKYRFEGRVRVSEVEPLRFGTHQGAGLRVSGGSRQAQDVVGSSGWQMLQTHFEIVSNARDLDCVCELRARAGEAWFDLSSLRLVRE